MRRITRLETLAIKMEAMAVFHEGPEQDLVGQWFDFAEKRAPKIFEKFDQKTLLGDFDGILRSRMIPKLVHHDNGSICANRAIIERILRENMGRA